MKIQTAAIAAILAAALPAHAGLILDQSPPNSNAIDITFSRVAQAFSVTSLSSVSRVAIWFQTDIFGSPSDLVDLGWAFYNDSGGAIGSSVNFGTATALTSFDSANNADFATIDISNVVLPVGIYWLEVHADGGNSIFWSNIDGTSSMPVLINMGAGTPNTPETFAGFQEMAFQLDGTGSAASIGGGPGPGPSAPEPASVLLFATSFALLAIGKFKFRKSGKN